MPSLACTWVAVAGKVSSGVVVPTMIRSTSCGGDAGGGERALGGVRRQVGGQFAVGRDVTLADAGAGDDPVVGRIELAGEFGVGEDPFRQIGAAADDLRAYVVHHPAASLPVWAGIGGEAGEVLLDALVDAVGDQLDGDADGVGRSRRRRCRRGS